MSRAPRRAPAQSLVTIVLEGPGEFSKWGHCGVHPHASHAGPVSSCRTQKQDSQGRGMAGELWRPPARFRSWLHCLTLGDPGRLPPCLSFRSYEVGIIIPASQEATGARSLSHVKDAGGAIVTQWGSG